MSDTLVGVAVLSASIRPNEMRRLRMSRAAWDEFCGSPEKPRTEFVDGEALVMAPVSGGHGKIVTRLVIVLSQHLAGLDIGPEIGLELPRNRVRAPDLLAAPGIADRGFFSGPATVVVEVVSHGTRVEDTIRKPMDYADGGVGQYWIVDPELRTIDVLTNADGRWEVLAHLTDDAPTADITVGEHGTVPLDLAAILLP